MRGERSGRLVLGVYDGGHIGPSFSFLYKTIVVSRLIWFPWETKFLFYSLADFVGDVEPPDNQQLEHCCRIKDAGIYRHHGRAAYFFGGVDTKAH
ncbi:hypothetical protein TNCV_3279901 [Trichonephila clavipes]|nr:hypothetical protein TNCV_3279901 [Trichonephila clavipes]